jgi:phage terminase Nu1 subunit (DNA packaging protein)
VTGGFTKTEIAKAFGVKPATVDKWVEEGIPREKVGRAYRYGWEAVRWAHEKRTKNGRTDAVASLRETRERLRAGCRVETPLNLVVQRSACRAAGRR